MKRLAFLPLAALAFVTACGDEATQPLEPDATAAFSTADSNPSVDITEPQVGGIFFDEEINFTAEVEGDRWWWAIRTPGCRHPDDTENVEVASGQWDDGEAWVEDGKLSFTKSALGLDAAEYCFTITADNGDRVSVDAPFYVVDNFAKVGGVLTSTTTGARARGNGTHAMEGLVGTAGDAGVVGSIAVNYRGLRKTVVYEASSLDFRAASGIGVDDPMGVAEIGTQEGGVILALASRHHDDFRRGAIVVRPDGSPGTTPYEIDGNPGSTGSDSWVEMTHGNNHTGSR